MFTNYKLVMPTSSMLIQIAEKPPQYSSAKQYATTNSHHVDNNLTNGELHCHQKRLFSSRLAASVKGRVSVVPYSADTINRHNFLKTRKTEAKHNANQPLCSPLTKSTTTYPKNPTPFSRSLRRPLVQHHEISSNSIVYQSTSKQITPTTITAYSVTSEKLKEHNAFITQSSLSRTSQIFRQPVEFKPNASDVKRSRSDILHSALCNIVATNYHSRRLQNAAMLFLEIGGFSPRVIDDEMKYYKKKPLDVVHNIKGSTDNLEESATSHCCSTFSDVAPANIMLELSAPVFSEMDNTGTISNKCANGDKTKFRHTGLAKLQLRSMFTHAITEPITLDCIQSTRLLQSASADCLQSRKRSVVYQLSDLLPHISQDTLNGDVASDSSSNSEVQCVSLTQQSNKILCRSFSLPRKNLLVNRQFLPRHEDMDTADLLSSASKHMSPDSLQDENELRQIAKESKLKRVQSFGEFTTKRRRKSKIIHFIPDFSYLNCSGPSPQHLSILSDLNEYHSINEKLDHVEAIGRSINNQHKVVPPHDHLSIEEAQHMLNLLCKDYYNDIRESRESKRYRGTRQIKYRNTYLHETNEEKDYYNAQSNDYSMIETLITHNQYPILHNYGLSHSIISYCNASIHKCCMGTLFDVLSLGRNFLYIVGFRTDMDTYFPQILALMLQEHPQKARISPSLIDNPPCVLPIDNPIINKTEMPILKIHQLFIDLSNSGLMDRAATVLNDCVSKRFFDLYMLFTIQSFTDSLTDISIYKLNISWELGFKLCYCILHANSDSHPIISWAPYGDVSYLISLVVFTSRCANGILNSIDCKESLLYTLILNYSIYESLYILLSAYKRYEDEHGPSIFIEASQLSSTYDHSSKWQTGSIFEIFTAELPIQFNEQYPETNPPMESHITMFRFLIGLQITSDFRLFEAIGLLVQNSHISMLITNLRRLKFLLILLIHLLNGYVLSNMYTSNVCEDITSQSVTAQQSKRSTIKDPFLISNLFYAIGSILGILLDKKLAQEQFNLNLLSDTADEEIRPDVKEAIYDLICLQSYCIRTLLLLLTHFLEDIELDIGEEVYRYGLSSIYASPHQDLYGLVPPYILLHDVRYMYKNLDFLLQPESIVAQHIILKHYCTGFLIRMIRSAISFNTISDLNSLLFMRNPLCLSIFWTLRKQPMASKYNLTHWYIDKFTQMTDRNFV